MKATHQDIVIASEFGFSRLDADNAAVARLQTTMEELRGNKTGQPVNIHLVLRQQELADFLKRTNHPDEGHIQLYTYTYEDLRSMALLGVCPYTMTRLDREPIEPNTKKTVHLVIFGAGPQAESLAIHTALTSHYPNYCRDNRLRTRITMIADSESAFSHFRHRYQTLLTHSYRRFVNINGDQVECNMLTPLYIGTRKNFVDVEWEFVNGQSHDDAIIYKLNQWAHDEHQLLTIALCHENGERNISEALTLPAEVMTNTPIWLYVHNATAISLLKQSGQYVNLIPFGMDDEALPDLSVFIRMAQCVHFAYTNPTVTDVPTEEDLQRLWSQSRLTTTKRWSNIYNGMTLRSKMHSLGHSDEEWKTFFSITEQEVNLLAEVEHNRWSVEELILGYRPTTDDEHASILQDVSLRSSFKAKHIHDDLRHFDELGVDQSGLSVVRYDVALTRILPLLAYTYHQLTRHS